MTFTRRSLLAGTVGSALHAQTRRPNVVLILADDLGNADLGFQGSKEIATPHLDALARGGVTFRQGYVSHPFCSPTRAGLLTGRYQQRFGHENNMVFNLEDPKTGLPLTERTMAELFRAAGYRTGLVGKWHLGAHPRFHPHKRGFEDMYGFVGGGHDYFDPGKPGDTRQMFIPIERNGSYVPEKEYLTTALGREAAAYVRKRKSDPFFLYFAFNAPHSPLQAPQRFIDRYKGIGDGNRRTYAAMVTAMDDAIGACLNAIREEGLERDTLVIFLNDNGGPKDNASSNAPLRGTKRTVYEGGIRVPFVMRWPGRLPSGAVYDRDPVISLDVLPTALAAAGVKPSQRPAFDGINLLPHITEGGAPLPRRNLYWRMFGGDYMAVRDHRYKLVRSKDGPDEFYDLRADIAESRNLIASKAAEAKRLARDLEQWHGAMAKPAWLDHIYHRDQLAAH